MCFWAPKLNGTKLGSRGFPGGTEVKPFTQCKLWAPRIKQKHTFAQLCVLLCCCWFSNYSDVQLTLFSGKNGWIEHSTRLRRQTHSLRHVLKLSRSHRRQPVKEKLREEERGAQNPRSSSHFIAHHTSIQKPQQSVKGSAVWGNNLESKR